MTMGVHGVPTIIMGAEVTGALLVEDMGALMEAVASVEGGFRVVAGVAMVVEVAAASNKPEAADVVPYK